MSKRVVDLTAEELDKLASDAWGTAAREALAQGHSVTGSIGDRRVRYDSDGAVTDLGPVSPSNAQSVINTGDLIVNLDTQTVEVGGQRVHLTGKEYQMLELLSLRKGTMLTKEMFFNHLYGGLDEPELKIIDVFIAKLRRKLASASSGKNYIETVWGRGYVLRDPDNEAIKQIS
jgi:DNA-binding response OmpR family regulator